MQSAMLFFFVIATERAKHFFANPAVVFSTLGNATRFGHLISDTIAQFFPVPVLATAIGKPDNLLKLQHPNPQEQLPEKSCYLIGYHKRDTQNFWQQMTPAEQQDFLQHLKLEYRQILIDYFTEDRKLKQKIDLFIDKVFSANIPVPEIIQLHMEIIDEFSKQLRLEGRSDEVLLDYRLTLIDILAHLCEVYRSSMPE
jgi:circadian clock protein KaiA